MLLLFLQNLLKGDDFYKIRLPSNVLSPPGREHIISSVKAVSSSLHKDAMTHIVLYIRIILLFHYIRIMPQLILLVLLYLVSSVWVVLFRIYFFLIKFRSSQKYLVNQVAKIWKEMILIKETNLKCLPVEFFVHAII